MEKGVPKRGNNIEIKDNMILELGSTDHTLLGKVIKVVKKLAYTKV